ncbi:hypothetical protein Dda_9465 [Drechslerella dactyloides]|uniref:Uncharacterized protein n=1 Tax=Drechslerella dactyloides TaxID=74499 RepID=A0AAD6IQ73_DREDA|nr:hypothetical protein Dda_9465 [Drechslerella dactyloides]
MPAGNGNEITEISYAILLLSVTPLETGPGIQSSGHFRPHAALKGAPEVDTFLIYISSDRPDEGSGYKAL